MVDSSRPSNGIRRHRLARRARLNGALTLPPSLSATSPSFTTEESRATPAEGAAGADGGRRRVSELVTRQTFLHRLERLQGPAITVHNDIDESSPPLSFRFISQNILREGVKIFQEDAMVGCNCAEKSDLGCEDEGGCECLDQMEEDKRRFPYHSHGHKKGTLRGKHLLTRDAIFECNKRCRCGPNCRNKLVQFGRQVPLEIFKTDNRGWGLRCPQDLRRGEFIDVYRGEIITEKECKKRDRVRHRSDVYTFGLDKFHADNEEHPWVQAHKFVVDGEFFGGPTRFINHSCDPNLRIFTVSLHHADPCLYELAFFAIKDIPAGTELSFDYVNKDVAEKDKKATRRSAIGKTRCLCGSDNCRLFLWI